MLPAHRWSFSDEWQQSAKGAEKLATHSREKAETFYNAHTRNLHEIWIRSNVAIKDSETKLWDINGIVIDIGPHRRYYIKTQSGCVLVRNCHFLHRRIPASIPNTQNQQPAQSQPACVQRQSCRQRNPTTNSAWDVVHWLFMLSTQWLLWFVVTRVVGTWTKGLHVAATQV